MPTTPPALSAILPFPALAERAAGTYNANAYACLNAWAITYGPQLAALAANAYANANDAFDSATAAENSSQNAATQASLAAASAIAAASAGPAWVSGTIYTLGQCVYSPVNYQIYRRTTAGAGTTDPSADNTNWALVGGAMQLVLASGTAQAASSGCHYALTNVAATTVTLPASPPAGSTVWVTPCNGLATNILARNGQNIMSLAEDMTIDNMSVTVELRYINSTVGWRLI